MRTSSARAAVSYNIRHSTRSRRAARSSGDCKINGVTPETGEAPVTVMAMDVSAESADGLDEQLVRQLAAGPG